MASPEYACAIIRDFDGRFLLEVRPDGARYAASMLTCFGGRVEVDESPLQALQRELREELQWSPATLRHSVDLWVAGAFMAAFFVADVDTRTTRLVTLPGVSIAALALDELSSESVHPWHRATLQAHAGNVARVSLEE